jgi:adenylate kinase
MPSRRIVLLGPPGAGKGTQAKLIAEKTGLLHLSTGDVLRDEVARGTGLGRKAKEYMDRGDLVPDRLVIDMVSGRIAAVGGFILDGFPRTVPQAEALAATTAVELAINITLGKDEVVRRLSARRVCRRCGRIHNLLFDRPEDPSVCSSCGGELFQRDDDRAEVIENRYDVYTVATAPLVDFYRRRGVLREVDGSIGRDGLCARILELVSA